MKPADGAGPGTDSERLGWPKRFLVRLLHVYFAVSRGMTLGVRAACFDEAGRIFLVRHTYVPGWHLPGGGVERGETALDALVKAAARFEVVNITCQEPSLEDIFLDLVAQGEPAA